MNVLKQVDSAISVREIGRSKTFITGATLVASGVRSAKRQPQMSVLKTILGTYLIYKALARDEHTAIY